MRHEARLNQLTFSQSKAPSRRRRTGSGICASRSQKSAARAHIPPSNLAFFTSPITGDIGFSYGHVAGTACVLPRLTGAQLHLCRQQSLRRLLRLLLPRASASWTVMRYIALIPCAQYESAGLPLEAVECVRARSRASAYLSHAHSAMYRDPNCALRPHGSIIPLTGVLQARRAPRAPGSRPATRSATTPPCALRLRLAGGADVRTGRHRQGRRRADAHRAHLGRDRRRRQRPPGREEGRAGRLSAAASSYTPLAVAASR